MNSDYATLINDHEFTMQVTIPDRMYIPANERVYYRAEYTLEGSASRPYRCFIESSAFNYAVTGATAVQIKYGGIPLKCVVSKDGNKYKLTINTNKSSQARNITGTMQTVTAHIQTFVDPFQV